MCLFPCVFPDHRFGEQGSRHSISRHRQADSALSLHSVSHHRQADSAHSQHSISRHQQAYTVHSRQAIHSLAQLSYTGLTPTVISQLGELVDSKQDDSDRYECHICHTILSTKETYKKHMISHSGRVYPCLICHKEFRHPNNLRQHVRIVHENRRFPCSICGRKFSTRQSCQGHQVSVHAQH